MDSTCSAIFIRKPVDYSGSLALLDHMSTLRIEGKIGDTVLFLEHSAVITMGRSAMRKNIIAEDQALEKSNIQICESPRGGDVTLHAPGQLVVYPVLKLAEPERDVHQYVGNLEETVIRTLADFEIGAGRNQGKPGAWTKRGKIAAIGVRIKRWVTSHGFSLNVSLDMNLYSMIVPCGLAGESVTSMKSLLGEACPTFDKVRQQCLEHLATVLNRKCVITEAKTLKEAASF